MHAGAYMAPVRLFHRQLNNNREDEDLCEIFITSPRNLSAYGAGLTLFPVYTTLHALCIVT